MQRRFALTLLSAALLAGTAQAQQSSPAPFNWTGLYGGINAGFGPSLDNKIRTQGTTPLTLGNVATGRVPGSLKNEKEGFIGGGQVGFNWQTGPFVYGAEADFDYTDLTHTKNYFSALNDRSAFNQKQYTLGTVRARFGYAVDRWLPYITGGWAYGRYSNNGNIFSNGPGTPLAFAGNQSGFGSGWTAGAGVEYAIPTAAFSMFGNAVTLRAEYLYYDLGSRTIGVNAVGAGATGGYATRFENKGQVARVGLNFKFGGPAQEVQQAVQRTYTPAPAPVQAPRSYLVFFDFDRSDLTPEANNIVRTAADNAKAGNVTRIEVTGHTDAAGSQPYNLRLSQRRAQTVQAELVRDGIPADQISVAAKGKSQPLVPTADGVREPQNRRVEIVYR
jgi:outer membrane immunogenic protein